MGLANVFYGIPSTITHTHVRNTRKRTIGHIGFLILTLSLSPSGKTFRFDEDYLRNRFLSSSFFSSSHSSYPLFSFLFFLGCFFFLFFSCVVGRFRSVQTRSMGGCCVRFRLASSVCSRSKSSFNQSILLLLWLKSIGLDLITCKINSAT